MHTGCDVLCVYIFMQLYCSSVLYVLSLVMSLPKDSYNNLLNATHYWRAGVRTQIRSTYSVTICTVPVTNIYNRLFRSLGGLATLTNQASTVRCRAVALQLATLPGFKVASNYEYLGENSEA